MTKKPMIKSIARRSFFLCITEGFGWDKKLAKFVKATIALGAVTKGG